MFKKGALLIYLWTEMLFYNPVQANNKIDMFCSPPSPPKKKQQTEKRNAKLFAFMDELKFCCVAKRGLLMCMTHTKYTMLY